MNTANPINGRPGRSGTYNKNAAPSPASATSVDGVPVTKRIGICPACGRMVAEGVLHGD